MRETGNKVLKKVVIKVGVEKDPKQSHSRFITSDLSLLQNLDFKTFCNDIS